MGADSDLGTDTGTAHQPGRETDGVQAAGATSEGGRHAEGPDVPPRVELSPPPRIRPVTPAGLGAQVELGRSRWPWFTVAAVLVSAAALVGVFVVLPRWVSERGSSPQEPVPAPEAELAPALPLEHGPGVEERSAEEVRQRLVSLEQRQAGVWGGAPWAEARRRARAGDSSRRAGDLATAAAAYAEAMHSLDDVEAEAGNAAGHALEEGRLALEAGDAEAARRAFELAALIQPGSPEAAEGLRRAGVHDRAFDLVQAAAGHERSGEPERAAEAARQALALDPSSHRAREILARSRQVITDREYARAVSEGLTALEDGRFSSARHSFERAAALRPGEPETADGLARASAGLQRQAVDSHRERALGLERAEQWTAAAAAYEQALAVDSTLAFAREGKARCLERDSLSKAIDAHLAHPGRLTNEQVLGEAAGLLEEARQVTPQGPEHRRKLERLAEVVRVASTPVAVTLVSDNLTRVVVYRVGRLGAFTRRTLELRPGSYVVVGSRNGFRDVRLRLEVTPDGVPEPLVVRCTEGI